MANWTFVGTARMGAEVILNPMYASGRAYLYARECFDMPNRVHRARDRDRADIYRVKPYVMATDIYCVGRLNGHGGWVSHAGSARQPNIVAVEDISGIRMRNGRRSIKPALPSNWDCFGADLDPPSGNYRISVSKAPDATGYSVTINDRATAHPEEGHPIGQ
ncbi:MAG: hypothetical protein E6Q76_00080 [Rhizobium sp.]|nr:MAG: hypothetical protein E6Q76_00080 [Rhizobium sp.]